MGRGGVRSAAAVLDFAGERMRAVVQRVLEASVSIDGRTVASIGRGLLVLVGIERGDTDAQAERLARRLPALRIFPDARQRMNLSLAEVGGEMLLVSQFTLAAETGRGRRPGFEGAAPPDQARHLVEGLQLRLRQSGIEVKAGVFGAMMSVHLVNDGPVTFVVDERPGPEAVE